VPPQTLPSAPAQRHRINRVINFIHANTDSPLDLQVLADQACLSKYHFARVFKNQHQQSPLQYLWRVRVERAARRLVFDQSTRITEIAHDCGFASSQTFAQCFRSRFGMSPRRYRINPVTPPSTLPIDRLIKTLTLDRVRVEHRPALRVAYIRNYGPYDRNTGRIPDAFSALDAWAIGKGMAPRGHAKIGLCPDNRRVTPDAFCLYDACIQVPNSIAEDDLISLQIIPAGTYAITPVHCQNTEILAHWEWVTTNWRDLCSKTYEQRWSYEVFHPNPHGTTNPADGLDLCLRLG